MPAFLTKKENKMLSSIIGPIGSLASTWLQGRVDKAKAETDVKVAKAKAEATNQMGESWKDEAWSIWFIAVLTCCFLPWTQEYVKEGFIFLDESTPNWFHNMLYIVIGSSFGYRFGKQGLQVLTKRGK